MFVNEQHIATHLKRNARNAGISPGTLLASRKYVHRKFTYKEFTLIIGVCVALIVALTVWGSQKKLRTSNSDLGSSRPTVSKVIYEIIGTTVSAISF